MALQVVCWLVFAFGALVIAMNWWCLIASRRGGRHISMVPLIGGVLAFVASAGLPFGWRIGALALVVDPACALMFVALLVMPLREWRRG